MTNEDWYTSAQLLQTIKGIGLMTTVCLLVTTLNFTTSETIESLTAYAGLCTNLAPAFGTSLRSDILEKHAYEQRCI
jgi:Transposase IS116/IS110/IS902 family